MPQPNNKVRRPAIVQHNFGNIDQLQKYNNAQVYTKGFGYTTAANTVNEYNPQLGGKARRLFGICLFWSSANQSDDDIISLTINQEVIVDQVNWKAYSPNTVNNPFKTDQFYTIPRGLSGSDSVLLSIKSVNSHAAYIVFYLANSMPE